jgi:photosystem II stability/assembly factor-like uncharacterized protein
MWRSTDNGITWIEINSGLSEFTSVRTLSVSSDNKIFVGTNYGAFLSENNGETWSDKNNTLLNTYINVLTINSSNNIYASVWAGGISRSTDNGETWTPKNNGLASATVYCIATKPGYIFAGTYNGIFRSTDDGESWTDCTNGLGSWDIRSLAVDSSGQVFVGTYTNTATNGVFKSTNNGDNWVYVGVNNNVIYSLAACSTSYLIAGVLGGIYRSTNNGTSWTFWYIGMPSYSVVRIFIVTPDNQIFAGTDYGIYRSSDFGVNWYNVGAGLLSSATIRSLTVDPQGYIFTGIDEGVFESTDNGNSWFEINNDSTSLITRSLISNSDGYIFAGTNGRGVFRSVSSTLSLPNRPILLSPENGSTVNTDTVLCTWTASSPSVTNYQLECAADSLFTTNVFVDSTITDTSYVIHNLEDNITHWWRVSARNGAGWSEFSAPHSFQVIITGVDKSDGVIAEFSFSQNYPNPFNPNTVIKFTISELRFTTLKIYDVLGREIATLVNEEKPAGKYEVEFNGSALTSGIYFYRIQAGNYTETRKMVLLR